MRGGGEIGVHGFAVAGGARGGVVYGAVCEGIGREMGMAAAADSFVEAAGSVELEVFSEDQFGVGAAVGVVAGHDAG